MSVPLFARLFVLAVASLAVPTTAPAQAPGEVPDATEPSHAVLEKLSEIQETQKEILERLKRLEASGSERQQASSAFSPVRIRVRSPEGKALAGYEAKLSTPLKERPTAAASGTSDSDGAAIERGMPYGVYNLSLKEPGGWFAYIEGVVVEVGEPLELEVVAPDPALQGKLLLRSELSKRAAAGLPFGEIREQDGIATLISFTAEPDQTKQTASFPTVENGIEEIAATLAISATNHLEQPNGKTVEWRWYGSFHRDVKGKLIATSQGVARWPDSEGGSTAPVEGAAFFESLDDDKQVGYLAVPTPEPAGDAPDFTVPAGDVKIQVTGLYGKASADVAKSLALAEREEVSIWLPVNLQQDSAWKQKLFDQEAWQPAESPSYVLSRTVPIAAGEEETVVLSSP